jgi:hypothetical protein
VVAFLVFFALAAIHDIAAVWWLELRDKGNKFLATLVSMALEALQWAPIWFAIKENDLTIAVAAIAGAGVGTWAGLKRNSFS